MIHDSCTASSLFQKITPQQLSAFYPTNLRFKKDHSACLQGIQLVTYQLQLPPALKHRPCIAILAGLGNSQIETVSAYMITHEWL